MKVPPIERKKFIVPVAVPSWCSDTAFWMSTMVNGNIGPSPGPASAMKASAAAGAKPVGASASGTSAAIATAKPASGTSLERVMRAIMRPATIEVMVAAPCNATVGSPDPATARPSASCA